MLGWEILSGEILSGPWGDKGRDSGAWPCFPVPTKTLLAHTPSSCLSVGGLPHNRDRVCATCTSSGSPDTGGSPCAPPQLGCRVREWFCHTDGHQEALREQRQTAMFVPLPTYTTTIEFDTWIKVRRRRKCRERVNDIQYRANGRDAQRAAAPLSRMTTPTSYGCHSKSRSPLTDHKPFDFVPRRVVDPRAPQATSRQRVRQRCSHNRRLCLGKRPEQGLERASLQTMEYDMIRGRKDTAMAVEHAIWQSCRPVVQYAGIRVNSKTEKL